jgi:hypothetical protein
MRDPLRSSSRKAWLGLSSTLFTYVFFAFSHSVWAEETEEIVDQRQVFAPSLVSGDYDGSFVTNLVVWRPSEGASCERNQCEGNWYIRGSEDETNAYSQQWGAKGDIPVPGDYDGDLINDFAVWRPSEELWYIIRSSDGHAGKFTFGRAGDIPVPGDYNGDGITDLAVWRPSEGKWIFRTSDPEGKQITVPLGRNGDIPVPGDYDGDFITDFAVWRPSERKWHIILSSKPNEEQQPVKLGLRGSSPVIPVPGDYDGDLKTDLAVWRPSDGNWYIIKSSDGKLLEPVPNWGLAGDVPVPGDYDGDGKTDLAVWRPSEGKWYIIRSSDGYVQEPKPQWGVEGDIPIVSLRLP